MSLPRKKPGKTNKPSNRKFSFSINVPNPKSLQDRSQPLPENAEHTITLQDDEFRGRFKKYRWIPNDKIVAKNRKPLSDDEINKIVDDAIDSVLKKRKNNKK